MLRWNGETVALAVDCDYSLCQDISDCSSADGEDWGQMFVELLEENLSFYKLSLSSILLKT